MINIILCGGSGTRLWPLSRTMLPKQFVRLFNGKSLFQDTVERNLDCCEEVMVVSNTDQYFLAVDQLSDIDMPESQFLLEPIGRNTAPAIALACMLVPEDEVVLVTPSDHLIKNRTSYRQAVKKAAGLALEGSLVTFGIKPEYPETGYGYIESSGENVVAFKEKPDINSAKQYIEQGNYYWNSGMFCFTAGTYLRELKLHSPEIYEACLIAVDGIQAENTDENRIDMNLMQAIPEESIDYAVMEKSANVKVVACDIEWSDLGSFDALLNEVHVTGEDNATLSTENSVEPVCIDSTDNLVISESRQIALVDIDNLLVVDTADALLISKKGSSQKIKDVVKVIKEKKAELAVTHRKVHRPWGTYEVLVDSSSYKIKRLIVTPGSKLSSQKHFHRNEHWIVVSGTATVTVAGETALLRPNESTYIEMGQVHRLENEGKIDLVMVEVQVGEYTGEDDIVRFEDIYGRKIPE